jgi:ATP-dependent helicase HrpB
VARKRDSAQLQSSQDPGQAKELVFASGGTARWEDRAWSVHSEYFVAVDAEERKGHGQARSFLQAKTVSSIEPDWLLDLDPAQVREESDCVIEGEKGRVEEISRLMYDQLVLSESRSRPQDPEKLGRLLARALLKKEGFLEKQESFAALQSRLRFLETHAPELGLQPLGAREIEEQLTIACWGKSTVSEALDVDLGEPARASLDSDKAKRLDQLAPDSVLIGRGRWAKISYEPGKPPWIESRLQDFFGLPKGPAVLGGRVPLTLHLLAPNYRAVQVTSDLEGFWVRDYPEVRKELSRRYPRHAWPENPRVELPKNVKPSSKG